MAERIDVPAQPLVSAADRLARSDALVADLPAVFTGSVFDPRDPSLTEVFMAGSQTTVMRIDGLPEPMQREIRWWLANCERTGKRRIHASEWNRWASTAGAVVERRPAVCSFVDLSLSEWMIAWSRVFHAERGQIAAPRSRDRAEIALRAMLRQLAVVYSDRAWWQHDVWSLQLDARIPRREHEPRANTATRWASISPDWLREGVKFYVHLGLESGYLSWSSVNPQHGLSPASAPSLSSRGWAIRHWSTIRLNYGRWHWRSAHSCTPGDATGRAAHRSAAGSTRTRSAARSTRSPGSTE